LLKKSIPAFSIVLKKSLTLQLTAFFIAFLALASCFLNNLPLIVQLSFLLAVVGFICDFLYSSVINYSGITKISCRADGYFELRGSGKKVVLCKLQKSTSVLGAFFFLHFQPVGGADLKPQNITLANDSLTGEGARQLRVALNVYKTNVLI